MKLEFGRFPILYSYREQRDAARLGWPVSVPLCLIQPHERQAIANHSQDLRTLAGRGGLHPIEMLAVITDQDYRAVEHLTTEQALAEVMRRGGRAREAA